MSLYAGTICHGSTQIVCESVMTVKPPMSKIVGEKFDAKVTKYATLHDKVLVKGFVEKTIMYLHPHFHHQKDDHCQKDDGKDDRKKDRDEKDCKKDGKCDDRKDDSKKNGKCDDRKDDSKKDGVNIKTVSCKRVDSIEGIVHFLEDVFEFTAVIDVPGVRSGDICKFDVFDVKVKDVSDFIVLDRDKKGLVTKGKELFLLDIRVAFKSKHHR